MLVWTPPHFWSLAVLLEDHYRAANVPMLPVVKGVRTTARRVLLYTILTVAVTLLPGVTGTFGAVYLSIRSSARRDLPGARLASLALDRTRERAAVAFHFSLLYLALLFVAVAVGAAAVSLRLARRGHAASIAQPPSA